MENDNNATSASFLVAELILRKGRALSMDPFLPISGLF